jgi:hypothetical protein
MLLSVCTAPRRTRSRSLHITPPDATRSKESSRMRLLGCEAPARFVDGNVLLGHRGWRSGSRSTRAHTVRTRDWRLAGQRSHNHNHHPDARATRASKYSRIRLPRYRRRPAQGRRMMSTMDADFAIEPLSVSSTSKTISPWRGPSQSCSFSSCTIANKRRRDSCPSYFLVAAYRSSGSRRIRPTAQDPPAVSVRRAAAGRCQRWDQAYAYE